MWTTMMKVLILEDEPTDAELVERTLRRGGLDVTVRIASSRASFAAALDASRPDILLTDFRLPDLDGFEVIRLAQAKYPDLPIIVVTGALGDEAAVELIKAGAVDYVLKDRLARLPLAARKAVLASERAAAERARSAAALQKMKVPAQTEQALFAAVTAGSNDAIIMIDARGIVTHWNKSANLLFGYSKQEAVGRAIHDLVATEQDRALARTGVSHFARTGKGPLVGRTREFTARKKDGTLIDVEISISAIQAEGEWAALGIVRDMSQRQKRS
jgi:PAS domain S-box-containing protein